MKFTVLIAACLALVQAAPLINNGGTAIANSYIVVLKDGHTTESFQGRFNSISRRTNGRGRKSTISRKFSAIPGFAATLNSAALKELLASDEVEFIEQDALASISGAQSSPPSYGLTRVSQRDLNLNQPYYYNNAAGTGVTAYVIDSGIQVSHSDFGGRATWGANFMSGTPNTDENGHGTHVAGTIGGTRHGVAKGVKLVGLKVLGRDGRGAISGIVAAMDWVLQRAVPGKSVINMSLGGGKFTSIDQAAARLYRANIPVFAAAGNSGTDACDDSPAGSPGVYTVAASDRNDYLAVETSPNWSSAWGRCVEIFAPGAKITSTYIGSNSATATLSGTSMASPHVAGVAALYLSFNSLPTAQAVYDKVTQTATPNKIRGNLRGTPNLLLFNGAA